MISDVLLPVVVDVAAVVIDVDVVSDVLLMIVLLLRLKNALDLSLDTGPPECANRLNQKTNALIPCFFNRMKSNIE